MCVHINVRIKTYPCEPRAASGPKGQAPSRLQRLEKLIGLEEGGQIQGIEQPKNDDVSQWDGRETRLALERGRRSALVAGHGCADALLVGGHWRTLKERVRLSWCAAAVVGSPFSVQRLLIGLPSRYVGLDWIGLLLLRCIAGLIDSQ